MPEQREIYAICTYCKQPIYRDELPCKGLDAHRKAHLNCFLQHLEEHSSKR